MPIPLANLRAASRRQLEARIAARPRPARFRTYALNVAFGEPAKARELRLAGYATSITAEVQIVLPPGAPRPQAEKENIEVTDWSDENIAYLIKSVTPLTGTGCYTLGLAARNTRPSRAAPAIAQAATAG